jgi:DNA invertase Pin-like site-specific DNA recombinase
MTAAIYLRVSTQEQANKNNEVEGYSIPAQRRACQQKARSLKAFDIEEYADRGASARSDDRPELQRLLQDLRAGKKFDYVIVHKVDRLARNLYDDVTIGLAIERAGATLVSVTETIDDTPQGRLMHGFMAVLAEYYSRNLATEALKGCTEKARRGGTPFKAPMGYHNIIKHHDGREIRTVVVDPMRAPLITWAFTQYATGQYSIQALSKAIVKRGFKPWRPGRQFGTSAMHRILTNRYYAGYVVYNGKEYRGRHKALVSPRVFAAVQAVIDSHRVGGNKSWIHDFYLTGSIYCGRCEDRMGYTLAKQKYGYFYCPKRKETGCTQRHLPTGLVEEAVSDCHRTVHMKDADQEQLVERLRAELLSEAQVVRASVAYQRRRKQRLTDQRARALQAYYDGVITTEQLQRDQDRLGGELGATETLLKEATERLKVVAKQHDAVIGSARDLNIAALYRKAQPLIQRYLNQALFSRIYVDNQAPPRQRQGKGKAHDVRVVRVQLRDNLNVERLVQALLALAV